MSNDTDYKEAKSTEDEFTILKALLDAPEDYVSGSLLAEQLGVSRPAIHGKLEKLREKNFDVEAVRNRGYRLVKEPEVLHPALIRYYLEAAATEIDVRYFPVIDSTNSEAERQITYATKSPFAIASSCQTKGRGRLGREWYSASADNLYLSVLFEPNIPPQQLQDFTLWAGIYICRALQSFTPKAKLQIKWPNDLHCDGRKFAGMLTEAKMDADSMRSIIFGIGINLNSNPSSFPKELQSIATSLYAINGQEVPINKVAARVLQAVNEAYEACIHDKTTETLPEAWTPLSSLNGKPVTALQGGKEISGIASGIDESGALLLTQPDGSTISIRAGDVTLKKN
ncbi:MULTISPECIES: biotin--[acetyl-CoA-carboxylase] ligase [unclassified Lentimonas]|uniref:biotin--[acetyl-CoA-carboxylase] ligase n=1 Tax=unclassified Lentimonas TaxID=2630993 RepID=UPI001320CEC9|nr:MULTISPECIES: biotin--[acetyl-CoA-carboxylase] ligase [unclassified Lentimonas]CAA6676386.1 Biotin--protein ligase (EC / Biotin operon repressor [Lentimonas sp. CC4]CAA6685225.1 Biotin--protein ligase (EC / Biotin operon repressor [Lentimonas sp. CC6]CAA7075050.1 Biotin--protein ligase (EC / Biotin operon repressor [Lentimonas sp. CC4]CAA7169645.1 Biotin--protein ligase (EC / Biotin operon repressor [Lentimonas sp. CC21]CAA7182074.1 Biotin--protein ligase (EC / Biotin operon repressor [Lent